MGHCLSHFTILPQYLIGGARTYYSVIFHYSNYILSCLKCECEYVNGVAGTRNILPTEIFNTGRAISRIVLFCEKRYLVFVTSVRNSSALLNNERERVTLWVCL